MQCKEDGNMCLLVIDQRWWKVINYGEVVFIKSSVLLNLEGYSAKSGIFFLDLQKRSSCHFFA